MEFIECMELQVLVFLLKSFLERKYFTSNNAFQGFFRC